MASLFLILIQIIIACQNSPPLSCRISVSGTEAGGIGRMLIPPGMQPPRRGRNRQSVSRQSRGGSPRGSSIRSVRLDASLAAGGLDSGDAAPGVAGGFGDIALGVGEGGDEAALGGVDRAAQAVDADEGVDGLTVGGIGAHLVEGSREEISCAVELTSK